MKLFVKCDVPKWQMSDSSTLRYRAFSIFNKFAHISRKADRIFMNMSSYMYLCTRKSPLILGVIQTWTYVYAKQLLSRYLNVSANSDITCCATNTQCDSMQLHELYNCIYLTHRNRRNHKNSNFACTHECTSHVTAMNVM